VSGLIFCQLRFTVTGKKQFMPRLPPAGAGAGADQYILYGLIFSGITHGGNCRQQLVVAQLHPAGEAAPPEGAAKPACTQSHGGRFENNPLETVAQVCLGAGNIFYCPQDVEPGAPDHAVCAQTLEFPGAYRPKIQQLKAHRVPEGAGGILQKELPQPASDLFADRSLIIGPHRVPFLNRFHYVHSSNALFLHYTRLFFTGPVYPIRLGNR
jgi:hypothetical protein